MRKRNLFILGILFILLVPFPINQKDGGSIEYKALLYSISVVNKLAPVESEKEYEKGIIISILGIEIYNNVG